VLQQENNAKRAKLTPQSDTVVSYMTLKIQVTDCSLDLNLVNWNVVCGLPFSMRFLYPNSILLLSRKG